MAMETYKLDAEVFKAENSDDGKMVWLTIVTNEGDQLRTFGFTEEVGDASAIALRKPQSIELQPYLKNGQFKARAVGLATSTVAKAA